MRSQLTKLRNITSKITKGTTPTTVGFDFLDKGINFIKAEALNGDSELDMSGFAYIDAEAHNKLKRSILQENDVLVTIAGVNIGKAGIVRQKHLPANTNQAVGIVRVKPDFANSAYVYYWLKNPLTFKYLQNINAQAAQPNINLEMLGNLSLPIPDLQTQRNISSAIEAYDQLININRRRIQLLEEGARLLFREWFVYFRFPGHEKVEIIDCVPEGWRKGILENIATVKKGVNITFDQAIEGDIPVVGGGLEPTYFHNKANVRAPVVTVSASGANAGYVNLYYSDVWASDCSYINKETTKHIYYLFLMLKGLQAYISGMQVGAAQPHVYPKDLMRLTVLIAPEALCRRFESLVTPIFNLIKNLKYQNQKLARARDLLLPRLMSGKIEV
jgi:type I restriction enzyme, S subunit